MPSPFRTVLAALASVDQDGFRVAAPITASTGAWVHERWSANELVPALEPAAPRWGEIIEWGLRFGEAAERARPTDTQVLDARTHRWAVADALAWAAADVRLSPEATQLREKLSTLLTPTPSSERHFVHGDLSGNVFVDAAGRPVILDVSPYLRPRRWAGAVVIADAVLWHGAVCPWRSGSLPASGIETSWDER